MYCPKCGKFYDYEGATCKECEEKDRNQSGGYYTNPDYNTYSSNSYYSGEPNPTSRAYGIGKAITSLVFSFVDYIFAYLALVLPVDTDLAAVGLVLAIISIPFIVISIAFGASCIQCFKRRKAAGCAKNVATLIIGICGMAWGIFVAFFAALAILCAFVLLVI